MDSSKGHLIRNRKTGPGWNSYSRMGALFPKIRTYITPPEFIIFLWISACLSCWSFSYQVSLFNYISLWKVDTTPCTYLMYHMFRFDFLDTAGTESIAVLVSYINAASTGSISSTEGPNTASAGNMMRSIQNPEYTSSIRRTHI